MWDTRAEQGTKKVVGHSLKPRKRAIAFSATSRVTERPIAGRVPRTNAALCAGDVERPGTSQRRVPGTWKPEGKNDEVPQASCMFRGVDKATSKETFVFLKNGDKILIVNAEMGKAPRFLVQNMPIVRGEVGNRTVS